MADDWSSPFMGTVQGHISWLQRFLRQGVLSRWDYARIRRVFKQRSTRWLKAAAARLPSEPSAELAAPTAAASEPASLRRVG